MTLEQVIATRRRSLLISAERNGVTEACRIFGMSRTTYYKIKKQFVETGSLLPRVRRKPRMPNEISLSKKKMLLRLVREHPTWGPVRYAHAFRQEGVYVSQTCVWEHLKRFGLNKRIQRLVYLEELRLDGQLLTERVLRSVKRQCNKVKKALWPGHFVGVDTFYIGNMKGVGRIYQFGGIDLYSRYGWAGLYTSKDQSASIDFMEKVLIPKFYQNGVEIESILTDNGGEFTGGKFQQMLADYDIKHSRIPKGKPMLNGCCERFQRTLHEEFYQRVFRTHIFKTLDELKKALNEYLVYYNFERVHFGVSKRGAVPIDVLKAKVSFLQQRFQKVLT